MTGFSLFNQSVSLLDRAPVDPRRTSAISIRERTKNACRAALARFMFRADAALQQVSTLSGGQLLRAGLACVLGGAMPPPLLLILDEPTNHLDIDSIAAVEAGLQAWPTARCLSSVDEVFLENIGVARRLQLPLGEEIIL